MRAFAFVSAMMIAVSLAGCQNQNQPESVPPSGPESGPALEEQVPEGSPAEMETAPGVEVRQLLALRGTGDMWSSDCRLWGSCLLVEAANDHRAGGRDLLGFDLETGERIFSLPLDGDWKNSYDLRRMGSGGFSIFTADQCRRYDWNGEQIEAFSLPEVARVGEGYPYNNYFRQEGSRWDVLPEKDLLAWCGPEGLWVAGVNGENPRLVLAAEAIGQQPEFPLFAQTVEDLQHLEPGEQVGFQSVRFMDEGRVLSADFGSPQMQTGVLGHVVVPLSDGAASWYDPYFVGAPNSGELEYLDDTTFLAGTTLINVTTGETSRAFRGEMNNGYYAITGDFFRYFGAEQSDTQYRLLCYDIEDRTSIRHLLTLPRRSEAADETAYLWFYPIAAEGNKVVCCYQLPGEEGLMLVTVPEE